MLVVLLNVTAVHPTLITSRVITITRQWTVYRPGVKANGACSYSCFRLSVVKEKNKIITNEIKRKISPGADKNSNSKQAVRVKRAKIRVTKS